MSEERKNLGIDEWLELVKEDKNLKGAYICFGQYMYLLEKENQQLKEESKYTVPIVEYNKIISEKNKEINQLKEAIEEVREYMNENRTRYIYQDSLGEDWRFDDLDVYSELLQILDKVKE